MGTAAAFLAQLSQRLGKPYSETIDGGVGPDYYDCSGLVMVCLDADGINYTRTTYSQWDDERFQHFGPFAYGAALPALQLGDVVYMHVAGEADPGHVGAYVGGGQYINAPHTGAFVRIETIPNTPDEHVFGIIRPPFAAAPVQPPPPPTTKEYIIMDSVVAPNGDIVSHAVTPQGHYLEITRKAGTQGLPATDGLSIIDVTVQYPQFVVSP